MRILIYLLISILLVSCDNASDQIKENDENWINVSDIKVLFSPKNNIDLLMINKIGEAKREVCVAIFDLTSEKIKDALIEAHKRGILVRVYNDKNPGPHEQPILDELIDAGISLKIADPKYWNENPENSFFSIMHNKILIIDDHTVMTGSYNFTKNAESNNRENIIMIPNKIITEKFYKQFNIYWKNP